MAPVRHMMGGVFIAVVVIFPLQPHAQPAMAKSTEAPSPIDRWQGFIAGASHRFGIPEAWIRAVMRAESGGNTMLDGHPITSNAGAMGLMQLMPGTWAELRAQFGLGTDPYDPHDNILAGTAYLRELYDRYGYPNLFAAYNAGPARLDAHLFGGPPLPAETQAYLASLGQPVFESPKPPPLPSDARLFFALQGSAGAASDSSQTLSSGGLFVPLNGQSGVSGRNHFSPLSDTNSPTAGSN